MIRVVVRCCRLGDACCVLFVVGAVACYSSCVVARCSLWCVVVCCCVLAVVCCLVLSLCVAWLVLSVVAVVVRCCLLII